MKPVSSTRGVTIVVPLLPSTLDLAPFRPSELFTHVHNDATRTCNQSKQKSNKAGQSEELEEYEKISNQNIKNWK